MVILFMLLLPIAMLGCAGALGVGMSVLLRGKLVVNQQDVLAEDAVRLMAAIVIAAGVPIIAGMSFALSRAAFMRELLGGTIEWLWLGVAIAFLTGLVTGWMYVRTAGGPPTEAARPGPRIKPCPAKGRRRGASAPP